MNSKELVLKQFNYQKCEQVSLKELGSKKKLECYYLTLKDECILLFCSFGKSRILKKDISVLEELYEKFVLKFDKRVDKKTFTHTSAICSKALLEAKSINWDVVCVSL